jgi:uncharacterized membrane protein
MAKVWLVVLALCTSAAADTGGRIGGGSWKSTGTTNSSSTTSLGHSSSSSSWSTPTTTTHSDFKWSTTPTYTPATVPSHGYIPPAGYESDGSAGAGGTYVPFDDPTPYTHSTDFLDYAVPFFIGLVALIIVGGLVKDFVLEHRPATTNYSMTAQRDLDAMLAQVVLVDVSVLRVALDGRARKFVQTELARIAKVADPSTDTGRVTLLREVTLMLRRLRDAWIYGGAVNEAEADMDTEKPIFDHHVDDARSRFMQETVSNVGGVQSAAEASHYVPRSDQGAGVILVSIIIAAKQELYTINQIGNGSDLSAALEAAGGLHESSLVAVEIVWQPAEDADRLSSIELEAKYPRPQLIPINGALVGKTFCTYCGGPYAAELVSCPHCGAPAAGRAA